MKKEQISFTEEDYAQLIAEYKANAKEVTGVLASEG